MIIDPYMEDLPELFRSYFVSILKVGYRIPRLEYYMTRGKYLLPIYFLYIIMQDIDLIFTPM